MTNDPQNQGSKDQPQDAAADTGSPETPTPAVKALRQIPSTSLLQGDREVQIVHGNEVYRLSLTRQGKLILHK